MDDSGPGSTTPSFKYRLKKSICCCFRQPGSSAAQSSSAAALANGYLSVPSTPGLHRSSSQWIKPRSPDFRDRCRSLITWFGNNHHHRRRRSQSVDYRYDALSYALNFEGVEELATQADEYIPLRNFTARLPPSPLGITMPLSAPAATGMSGMTVTEFSRPERTTSDGVVGMKVEISREITACSLRNHRSLSLESKSYALVRDEYVM